MQQKTNNKRVLLLDTNHPILQEKLTAAGFICDYFFDLTLHRLREIIPVYSGIIVRSRFRLDAELLSRAVNLNFIGRVGAGMEGIDTVFAREAGIQCFNAPEGNRNAVGEHAVGMLLALFNKMIRADAEVREGIWKREENRGVELEGKTVGIIGYGNTGGAFAKKLSGFDCNVLAYDKYKKDFSDAYVEEVSMDDIYLQTDVLSLHVPLTVETEYLVDKDYLARFSKSIWLVNTARGPVVNTTDLVASLNSDKVLGAALDVLEYESLSFESLAGEELPEPYQALAKSDKVILSPHIAGWTLASKVKLAEVIVGKILLNFQVPNS